MSYLWDKLGIPRKGWICVTVIDLRPDGAPVEETDYETCQMCGNEKIRYVHIMGHAEVEEELRVGCVCAEKMSADYENPRKRQNELRNRANRRAKQKAEWLKRNWRRSAHGNLWLKMVICNITIFPSKFATGKWTFRVDQSYSQRVYDSETDAQIASFDDYWRILEARSS
ncbi:hypothetical protein IAD21_04994 [Abditibacteriota bacterium]|nr:hypothetical protein IAD21_04994 [Abditibacteriota bacterium]